MQIINFYQKIKEPLSMHVSMSACSEASVNNENLYSANKRIIDKDKDNLEEIKPEREKT